MEDLIKRIDLEISFRVDNYLLRLEKIFNSLDLKINTYIDEKELEIKNLITSEISENNEKLKDLLDNYENNFRKKNKEMLMCEKMRYRQKRNYMKK